VTAATEEKILSELETLKALIAANGTNWLPKRLMMVMTGLTSQSIDVYVSKGYIEKRRTLYSYKSYLEFCEIKSIRPFRRGVTNENKHLIHG
jgi:hypothetical protein